MTEATAPLLIRVDDLGRDRPSDRAFLTAALASGLRVTCGVVPDWLGSESSCVSFLRDLGRRFAEAVEVHQHGYRHLDHSAGGPFKFEHDASREWDVQLAELRTGFDRLQTIFGDLFVPVLSPPFGHIDDTVRALATAVGFHGLSGMDDEVGDAVLPAVSPQVDPLIWSRPPQHRVWSEVVVQYRSLSTTPLVGVVVHPDEYSASEAAQLAYRLGDLAGSGGTVHLRAAFGWEG